MIKTKDCYLNCVTQDQNVRLQRLSDCPNKPRESQEPRPGLSPFLPGWGSPTGEAASTPGAVFPSDGALMVSPGSLRQLLANAAIAASRAPPKWGLSQLSSMN